jgi:hypothetical protein
MQQKNARRERQALAGANLKKACIDLLRSIKQTLQRYQVFGALTELL